MQSPTRATAVSSRWYAGHQYRVVHTQDGWRGQVLKDGEVFMTTKPFQASKSADGAAVRCIQDIINGTFD